MLEDRSYMRQPRFGAQRSATVILLIALVVAFLAQFGAERFSGFSVHTYFALSLEGLRHGYVWQLLTYQFMHGSLWHLLFNCWAIYLFGRELEEMLGRGRFLALYFSSGVIGGLVQVMAALAVPLTFGGPVVGASAAAFGLVAAFALLFPDRVLLLFFVIPMRAKMLLVLCAVLAVAGMVLPHSGNPSGVRIADPAHLGGMLTGVLFVRHAAQWEWPRLQRPPRRPARRLARVPSQKGSIWGRSKGTPDEDLPAEEFLSKEG